MPNRRETGPQLEARRKLLVVLIDLGPELDEALVCPQKMLHRIAVRIVPRDELLEMCPPDPPLVATPPPVEFTDEL
jgi:hypothetical protein